MTPTAAKARSSSAPPPWATWEEAIGGNTLGRWYRAGNDCFRHRATRAPSPGRSHSVSSASSTSIRATDGTNTKENSRRTATTPYSRWRPTMQLNSGNLAYGNLVDDVSVAAEGGDGGSLVTNGGFESASLMERRTGLSNAPVSQRRNAAARTRITRTRPLAEPHRLQSANKRRLASLAGSVIALPYFVPRKPFEADVGAVRAWESPYATAKLNNR